LPEYGYIYGLRDPRSGPIRYVGKTTRPVERLCEHISECYRADTYKNRWLISLLDAGVEPAMDILYFCEVEDLDDHERRLIAEYRVLVGRKLTNGTAGGTGGALLPEIAKAAGEKRRGMKLSAETRAAQSVAAKRRCEDPAERERLRSIADASYLPVMRGEANKASKLTEDDVREIRRLHGEGATCTALAAQFDVSKVNISLIVRRKAWTHVV
jgi:hypothetical protein